MFGILLCFGQYVFPCLFFQMEKNYIVDTIQNDNRYYCFSSCMKSINRQERVNIREVSSTAKILGTAVCVGGAITIAFFRGPKLPNQFLSDPFMLVDEFSSNWVMGALFLVGSSSCWSFWLILQVNSRCNHYMPSQEFYYSSEE